MSPIHVDIRLYSVNQFEPLARVALFADWPGRPLALAAARAGRALPREGGRQEFVRRLLAVGHTHAASLLADDELLEQATAVIRRRAEAGWEPLLPEMYPPKLLGTAAASPPPLLWVYGHSAALRRPGIGIVGSRSLSPAEARFASDAGEACAHAGMPVFSGGAMGADSFGAMGAARAGGIAAHFLPGGRPEPSGPVPLLASNPDAPAFDRLTALARNDWVYGAAEATLVVASRFGVGGSWAGAISALRSRLGRVLVYISERPSSGNVALAKIGATPVTNLDAFRRQIGHSPQLRLAV